MIRRPPRSTLFPYRRSSDLSKRRTPKFPLIEIGRAQHRDEALAGLERWKTDRKSTRLNSSHLVISYAVFCLKKKYHAMWNPARQRRQTEQIRESTASIAYVS